jgi:hypothetical protein
VTHKIEESGKPLRAGWWILAIIVFGLSIAIRIRLLGVPLERDEGEYAYAGQLILQGVPPYTLAYNMKFPGTYAAYAAIMSIFGQTITGIHLGLLHVLYCSRCSAEHCFCSKPRTGKLLDRYSRAGCFSALES